MVSGASEGALHTASSESSSSARSLRACFSADHVVRVQYISMLAHIYGMYVLWAGLARGASSALWAAFGVGCEEDLLAKFSE